MKQETSCERCDDQHVTGVGQRKNLASPKGFDDLLNKGSAEGGGGGEGESILSNPF